MKSLTNCEIFQVTLFWKLVLAFRQPPVTLKVFQKLPRVILKAKVGHTLQKINQ
jgi:hypothetical protein